MRPPRLGVTLGDPRGIGPEVAAAAFRALGTDGPAHLVAIGPPELLGDLPAGVEAEPAGGWSGGGDREAGAAAGAAIEHGIRLALDGRLDGLVTAPISKAALAAAGYPFPGHTEFLRERTGADDVTMVMAAETTPLGGPLRVALVTVHVPLREVPGRLSVELVARRAAIAARGLRDWWGIARPRLAFAGVNPHASEGGLFGDEEERVLTPAMRRLEEEMPGVEASGPFPADTVFRRCLAGEADAVVVPYHDVGLAVLKTLAPETGINVTTGLPFPRTSPDHGTAFDIAGRGRADPRSMREAVEACARFCARLAGDGT
ncbi:MAG: 4-hydroxythreonine-4-phosphate dehydrogenase PdxA [Gemmatimonadota bacterium]|nr:4-hydroxythreonine-4-phosphate dehydrogenase PdxA [Gemmatimonadota bacterium]